MEPKKRVISIELGHTLYAKLTTGERLLPPDVKERLKSRIEEIIQGATRDCRITTLPWDGPYALNLDFDGKNIRLAFSLADGNKPVKTVEFPYDEVRGVLGRSWGHLIKMHKVDFQYADAWQELDKFRKFHHYSGAVRLSQVLDQKGLTVNFEEFALILYDVLLGVLPVEENTRLQMSRGSVKMEGRY